MQKARAFFVFILVMVMGFPVFSGLPPGGLPLGGVPLYAQEEDPDYEEPDNADGGIPTEPDWDSYRPDLYSRGDRFFTISLGMVFPVLFLNGGNVVDHNLSPPVGGTGYFAYSHFLGPHFNVGGEVGVMINGTLAKNTLFVIPIGLRAGYQFVVRRFEFPLNLTLGIAPQRYLNDSYLGFFMKGAASAFFRFNPDWSFGANIDWTWLPQWPKEDGKPAPDKNMDGNMLGATLSARYHF